MIGIREEKTKTLNKKSCLKIESKMGTFYLNKVNLFVEVYIKMKYLN